MHDKQIRLDTHNAMQKALEAFEKHLRSKGYDTSYWSILLNVWLLSQDEFAPLEKMTIDTRGWSIGSWKQDGSKGSSM
jgi:hypothetical protein